MKLTGTTKQRRRRFLVIGLVELAQLLVEVGDHHEVGRPWEQLARSILLPPKVTLSALGREAIATGALRLALDHVEE